MGSGKTTIGQILAKKLALDFVDSDHEIERRTGVNIATIFEIEGETAFRARETAVLDELTQRGDQVLATGGGAVIREENRALLRDRGHVVYLHSPAEVAFDRIKRNRDRPLLMVTDPLARLKQLYDVRHQLYLDTAHKVVESYRDRPNAVISEIVAGFRDSSAHS